MAKFKVNDRVTRIRKIIDYGVVLITHGMVIKEYSQTQLIVQWYDQWHTREIVFDADLSLTKEADIPEEARKKKITG